MKSFTLEELSKAVSNIFEPRVVKVNQKDNTASIRLVCVSPSLYRDNMKDKISAISNIYILPQNAAVNMMPLVDTDKEKDYDRVVGAINALYLIAHALFVVKDRSNFMMFGNIDSLVNNFNTYDAENMSLKLDMFTYSLSLEISHREVFKDEESSDMYIVHNVSAFLKPNKTSVDLKTDLYTKYKYHMEQSDYSELSFFIERAIQASK